MTGDSAAKNNGRGLSVTWAALVAALSIGITIVGGAIAILNWLYTENNRLRAEITAVRIEFVRDQVTRPELKEALDEITTRIEKRLDRIEAAMTARVSGD